MPVVADHRVFTAFKDVNLMKFNARVQKRKCPFLFYWAEAIKQLSAYTHMYIACI